MYMNTDETTKKEGEEMTPETETPTMEPTAQPEEQTEAAA